MQKTKPKQSKTKRTKNPDKNIFVKNVFYVFQGTAKSCQAAPLSFPTSPQMLPFLAKKNLKFENFLTTNVSQNPGPFLWFFHLIFKVSSGNSKILFWWKIFNQLCSLVSANSHTGKTVHLPREETVREGRTWGRQWLMLLSPATCPSQRCALLQAAALGETHLSRDVSGLNFSWQVNFIIQVFCPVEGRCGWHSRITKRPQDLEEKNPALLTHVN